MEKANKVDFENKKIAIDVFESIQIDYRPTKIKRRRQAEDYDYNDDFLEPFEGELDPVELECRLENFFIYKGRMEENPKKIARRYNNSLKKIKLVDSIKNAEQKQEATAKHPILFEFQKMLANAYNFSSKYKKETRFENAIMCLVFDETPKDDFERYLKYKLLALYDSSRFGDEILQFKDMPADFHQRELELKNQIEDIFKEFLKISNDKSNFSNDRKIFDKFQDKLFMKDVVNFFIKYMKFYALKTDESLPNIKNSALEYLNAMLPEKCTNNIKIKHYLIKYIHKEVQDRKYDLPMVIKGEFVKSSGDDAQENKHEAANLGEDSKNKKTKPKPSSDTVIDKALPENTNALSFPGTSVSSEDVKTLGQTQSYENSEFLKLESTVDTLKSEKSMEQSCDDPKNMPNSLRYANSNEDLHYKSSYNLFNDISSTQAAAGRSTPNFGSSQFHPHTLAKYLKYPTYESNCVNDFDRLQVKKNPRNPKASKKTAPENLNGMNFRNEDGLDSKTTPPPVKRKYVRKIRNNKTDGKTDNKNGNNVDNNAANKVDNNAANKVDNDTANNVDNNACNNAHESNGLDKK